MFQHNWISIFYKWMFAAAFILALPALAASATYYVNAASGDDILNNGLSPGSAFQTITHAATQATTGTSGAPDVIMVAAGTYDNTTNGEIFPINFIHDHVSLTGAQSSTTFIDAQAAPNALDIDATGFSISGFTLKNTATAIEISESGFNVTGCVFDTTVGSGISANMIAPDLTTDFTYHAVTVSNNTFQTNIQGMLIQSTIDSDTLTENLTVIVEDVTITGNSFSLTGGIGLFGPFFGIQEFYNSTVLVGDVIVTNNTFTGGNTGFSIFSMINSMEDCQATVGNLTVSNNTFTDLSGTAIQVDYWDSGNHHGSTSINLGDLTVSGNTVTTSNYATFPANGGIFVSDIGFFSAVYDEASITTGTTSVTNNSVDVSNSAFGVYFLNIGNLGEEYWDDLATVNLGSFTCTGNSFTSNALNAAVIVYSGIAHSTYGQSAVTLGPLTFSNNILSSETQALVFSAVTTGWNMHENSSLAMNSITINNNTMTSNNNEALLFDFSAFGAQMDGNASFTFSPLNITNNTLTTGNGRAVSSTLSSFGHELYDSAAFTVSPITLDNNTINAAGGNGIFLMYMPRTVGSHLENNAAAILPDWVITNNSIDVTGGLGAIEFFSDENPYENFDHSQAVFGSFLIDGNIFNPNKDAGVDFGISIYQEDVGYDIYGPSTTTSGDITITNNQFYTLASYAIYVEYDYIGYNMIGTPSLNLGGIEIGDNIIDKSDVGIYANITDLQAMDAANVSFGSLNVHDNTLTRITSNGIDVEYGTTNSDPMSAVLTVDAPTFKGNTLTASTTTGIGINLLVNTATDGITFGTPLMMGNTITAFDYGILLDTVEEATLTCNYLESNVGGGVRIDSEGTFTLDLNSFNNNTVNGLTVSNGYPATVMAENNWWGDKLGPVACASCNGINPGDMGTIDYTPWLTYQPQKSRCGMPFPWVMFTPATTGMKPTP